MRKKIILLMALSALSLPVMAQAFWSSSLQRQLLDASHDQDVAKVSALLANPKLKPKDINPDCAQGAICKPLFYAILGPDLRGGSYEITKMLLNHGANPNEWMNEFRDSGLMLTVLTDHFDAAHLRMAQLLIQHGADVNDANDCCGVAPLHAAASFGDIPFIELLVSNGANVNQPIRKNPASRLDSDNQGVTPIMIAAEKGHEAAFMYLLRKGANLKARDDKGLSVLDHARLGKNSAILHILSTQQ